MDSKIPGGTVNFVYCMCIAGLFGTCNHLATMFFSRVNFNLTKLTSASKLCIWNTPFGCKVDTAPKGIKDISFDMAQYTKEGKSKNKYCK